MVHAKKKLLLIIMIVGILLFTGCDMFSFGIFQAEDGDSSSVITLAPDSDSQDTSVVTKDAPDTKKDQEQKEVTDTEQAPTSVAIAPAQTIDLPIYTVNVSTGETEPMIATIPKDTELTPKLIVEKVVESMADRSLDVGVKSVTPKEDAVIVDFYKDKAPLSEMGSGYEAAILDAIAMSLIDNLEDLNKVIYEAEGEAYVSGHIELGVDEPYLTR